MTAELFANTPSTTVSSGGTDAPVSGTSESWTVAASTSFPAAATGVTQFHISDPAQPSEVITVTNISGATWTVTRGAESSTPVAHSAGFTVKQVVTAGFLAGLSPVSGQFLCAPSSYAPPTQTPLSVGSTTFAVPGLSTTVASGSNGGEISTVASWSAPSNGVLDVVSTTGFPSTGTLLVSATGGGNAIAIVTYTGTSGGNSFTGCAYVSGAATNTLATGSIVALSGATPAVSTGAFSAPPSGNVLVSVYAVFQDFGATASTFGLAAHNTVTPMIGSSVQAKQSSSGSTPAFVALSFPVTGLTPGTSYNFDLLMASATGTPATIFAFSQTSTTPTISAAGVGAPVVMTVQAI